MGQLIKELEDIKKKLRRVDKILNAMAVIAFTEGKKAHNRTEESLAGFLMQAHRIIARLVNEDETAEKLIKGVEKMLLEEV